MTSQSMSSDVEGRAKVHQIHLFSPFDKRGMTGGFLDLFALLASFDAAQDMLGGRNFLKVILLNILSVRI